MSAAQARIVDLDNTIVDKDKRIAILESRVKQLEDRETEHVYNKYFPRNNQTQCTRCNIDSCEDNHSTSCSHKYKACRQHCSHPHEGAARPDYLLANQSTTSLLQSINDVLIKLLDVTNRQYDRQCDAPVTSSRVTHSEAPHPFSQPNETDLLDSDVSFASVESEIDDIVDLN